MSPRSTVLELDGREVTITNPDKVFFPKTGHTKIDLVNYYLAVAEGALTGVRGRPMALKRFVNGADGQAFFQKRVPDKHPEWIETVQLSYPSGRTADEITTTSASPPSTGSSTISLTTSADEPPAGCRSRTTAITFWSRTRPRA